MAATVTPSDALSASSTNTQNELFLEYEDEIQRNPYAVQVWVAYIHALSDSDPHSRFKVYERAVELMPLSYKLWTMYLKDYYVTQVRGQRPDSPSISTLQELYERCLTQLGKMPRLWLNYTSFLQEFERIIACRHAFDRAIKVLPITQHHRIWTPYLSFVKDVGIHRIVIRTYKRYLRLEPRAREELVDYLLSNKQYEEGSRQLLQLIEEHDQYPAPNKTFHAMWMQLCDLLSQRASSVASDIDAEVILRKGMTQFSDEVGRLWCSLSTHFVRLGNFDKARATYEEGLETVLTVRDFSMIFDAYVKFLEAMLTAEMKLVEDDDLPPKEKDEHQEQVQTLLQQYEDLVERRPVLLNSVLLRQNPHSVKDWEKRIDLIQSSSSEPQEVLRTFAEAVKTVEPARAPGKVHILWTKFARYYEDHNDLSNARKIFERAVDVDFRSDGELGTVYCDWIEMEVRQENFDEALDLARKACQVPESRALRLRQKKPLKAQDKVHRSVKLWNLRLDLEESLGDVESTRAAYNDVMDLHVATVQMVLNFANYLEEQKYFEESFRVYERGLALFPKFPHAADIWRVYLTKFVKRYGGSKRERARDLHEQAVASAPEKHAKELYLLFADFEEKHGMLRNVMNVLDRATEHVLPEEQLEVYKVYVKKAQAFFGVSKVRQVYQSGIQKVKEDNVPPLCLEFASMETKLGEIDRARAIYAHASQYCDPRRYEEKFWQVWHEFEVAHGSEETFLDMLRIKRSVTALYSHVNYMSADAASGQDAQTHAGTGMVAASSAETGGDPMANLEAEVAPTDSKKRSGEQEEEERNVRQKTDEVVENEEEIDLDEDDIDEVEQKEVPATLYGKSNA